MEYILGQNTEFKLKENLQARTTFLVARSYPYQDENMIGFQVTISYENQNLLQT